MKQCNACKSTLDDSVNFCTDCGSNDLTVIEKATEQAQQPPQAQPTEAQTEIQYDNSAYPPQYAQYDPSLNQPFQNAEHGNGNILAGVVGAFLFSIIGGILYFIIYQLGIIAGICGLVMFILANFGYGLFAQTKNKASVPGLIASFAAMVIMIFLAEYACVAYEIYIAFKADFNITIFDALVSTPDFMFDPEILPSVLGDLAFSYLFGILASVSNIREIIKAKKAQQPENPYQM